MTNFIGLETSTLTFYNDIHLFAPNALDFDLRRFSFGPSFFYLGDIVDLANVRKKDLAEARKLYQWFKSKLNINWIDGNHERMSMENDVFIATLPGYKRVIMAHGDFESWGSDKAREYRQKLQSAGWLKRTFVVNTIEAYEKALGRSVSKSTAQRAALLAKNYGCTVYVGGHLHVDKIYDQMVDGVRVIFLPRGVTTMTL